jgi:hypothetical protein
MHLYLLGYEFPNSIMLLTKGNFYFMATAEKCKYLKDSILPKQDENASIKIHLVERSKDSGANRELMHDLLGAVRKNHGSKIASLFKTDYQGKFVPEWMEMVKGSGLDMIEATPGLSHLLSTKDETELVSTFYFRSLLVFMPVTDMVMNASHDNHQLTTFIMFSILFIHHHHHHHHHHHLSSFVEKLQECSRAHKQSVEAQLRGGDGDDPGRGLQGDPLQHRQQGRERPQRPYCCGQGSTGQRGCLLLSYRAERWQVRHQDQCDV